MAAIVILNFI